MRKSAGKKREWLVLKWQSNIVLQTEKQGGSSSLILYTTLQYSNVLVTCIDYFLKNDAVFPIVRYGR
jgi:hypothetical protein